jgi:hypothetical protein
MPLDQGRDFECDGAACGHGNVGAGLCANGKDWFEWEKGYKVS